MNARTPYQGLPPVAATPPAEPSTRERIARLKTLARRAFGYWRISLVILVLGCSGALYAGMKVKLIYKSECTILYKPAMHTGGREEEGGERATRVGEKLKDQLMTRTRLEALIKQFGLYPQVVESRGMVDAIEQMRPHIGFRARDSETFVISFENEVPDITPKVATALANSMISEYANSNLKQAQQEYEFLTKQEQRSATESENANKALATFLTIHPEFAADTKGSGGGAPQGPTIPKLPKESVQTMGDPQLAVLYRQKLRLEAELKNNAGSPASPNAPAPTGDSIAKLTAARDAAARALATASGDLDAKRMRLTDEHPDVVSAKITVDGAQRQFRAAEQALTAAQAAQSGQIGNPYEGSPTDANLQRKINQLSAEIAARQEALRHGTATPQAAADAGAAPEPVGETSELVQLETESARLLNTLRDTRAEHDDLNARQERARIKMESLKDEGSDQMSIIDPAYKPLHPTRGGRTTTALAGGAVALVIAMAYAFARVLFNDTLIDAADIDGLQVIPVLGVLPKVRPEAPARPAKEPQRGV